MTTTFPDGFLWGTATAAHQVEGSNWNNDWWAWEHAEGTACVEASGDACDHYWRYPSDLDLLTELGFTSYRFSLEWSRIEPEEGEWSLAQLDHYARMLDACHERDLLPVVTFHHFTTPRWAAADGGWTNPVTAERFARFCERAVAHLGDRIAMACTINEPNVVSTIGYLVGAFPPGRTQDLDGFVKATETLVAAHGRAFEVLKAGPGDFPVGLTLSMGDWGAEPGHEDKIAEYRAHHEDVYLEAARGDDYFGVQAYSRTRVGAAGVIGPEPGVEVLPMGYEYWPTAAEAAIRHAAEIVQIPLYVTENGIGTDDDEQRVRYLRASLEGVARTIDDGIDVRGFFHWSLLDNFEWAFGYLMAFGLVAVDRTTQARTIKQSARWLSEVVRTNRLGA
ncbi:MAG: family 1 glycosylhydrolase [Acidimicrobiia bacterium]|jgi:beta-glucosidase|nr:family 1 glycosylhydrolase [Acidimicrobiia bacterium]